VSPARNATRTRWSPALNSNSRAPAGDRTARRTVHGDVVPPLRSMCTSLRSSRRLRPPPSRCSSSTRRPRSSRRRGIRARAAFDLSAREPATTLARASSRGAISARRRGTAAAFGFVVRHGSVLPFGFAASGSEGERRPSSRLRLPLRLTDRIRRGASAFGTGAVGLLKLSGTRELAAVIAVRRGLVETDHHWGPLRVPSAGRASCGVCYRIARTSARTTIASNAAWRGSRSARRRVMRPPAPRRLAPRTAGTESRTSARAASSAGARRTGTPGRASRSRRSRGSPAPARSARFAPRRLRLNELPGLVTQVTQVTLF
jgi:hypothetical protein